MTKDFRKNYVKIGVGDHIVTATWYRSPLWSNDHLLGADDAFKSTGLAWCGRPLEAARDWGAEESGLWISERISGKCAHCARRQKEWDGVKQT